MPKYVIEREIPGAGQFSALDLTEIAHRSCAILHDLGTGIHWIHSYVTDDKIYCVYHAVNEDLIRQHADRGGFPSSAINEVRTIIDPATSE